jgi:hypothetical protein
MNRTKVIASFATVLAALVLANRDGQAHKPITSPYTYNEDVFPIVRERCGQCHVQGGIAPMSLMTYKDAYPWGESIRTELIAGHMPPWGIESGHANIKNARTLTARELNVLLTWATGGNPVGNIERTLEPVGLTRDWRLGTPDLVLPAPAELGLAADVAETTAEFTLRTGTTEAKWVRAVDLLPGNPAIVRSATVAIKPNTSPSDSALPAGGRLGPEQVLAMWLPGETPISPGASGAFPLPAGAELVVRMRYKKTWQYERVAMTDRSTIGLYFAPIPASEIRALTLEPTNAAAGKDSGDNEASATVGYNTADDLRAVALYADVALANATVEVTAVRPNGGPEEIIRFRPQPEWARRYWFEQPIALPRGTRVEVATTADAPLLPPGSVPVQTKPLDRRAVRLTLDVVVGR